MVARAAQGLRLALLAGLLALAAPVSAMSPEEAYAAIPHQRTAFEARKSTLPTAKSESLARLFALTDRGVVLRVQGMAAQQRGDAKELARVIEGYDALAAELQAERFEPEVIPARDQVVEALRLQRRFFAARPTSVARQILSSTPEVRQSSNQLHGAYGVLMRAFPGEIPKHKQSFFDHLCALDFL